LTGQKFSEFFANEVAGACALGEYDAGAPTSFVAALCNSIASAIEDDLTIDGLCRRIDEAIGMEQDSPLSEMIWDRSCPETWAEWWELDTYR